MTVESSDRKSQSTLDGTTTEFDFTFRALPGSPTDIKCSALTGSTNTLLAYTTHYTATVSTDGLGGTVWLVNAAAVSKGTLTIYRETTNLQESDYDDYNQFPANTLEGDIDRRTLVDQEQSEDLGRTLKLPVSSTITGLVLPTPSAGKGLKWSADALSMTNTDVDIDTAIAAALAAQTAAEVAETAAESSATVAVASQAAAASSATSASSHATTAVTSATTATSEATTAIAQAVLTSSNATTALTASTTASSHATTALTASTTATSSSTVATSQATTANTSAATATSSSTVATSQATTATTQATASSSYSTTALSAVQIIVNEVTANYTLAVSDVNKLIDANSAGTITITVPSYSSIAIPTGSVICIRQKGAGKVVIAAAGVTINKPVGLNTVAQFSLASLVHITTDTWNACGDLEA